MNGVGVLLLAQAISGAPAAEEASVPSAPPVTRPKWVRRPSGDDMARNYPDAAASDRVNGVAVMVCAVGPDGELANCRISEVEPKGRGFDEATLRLAKRFKMREVDADGAATAGRSVRIPVRWVLSPVATKSVTVRYGGQIGKAEVDCRSRGGRLDECVPVGAEPNSPELLAAAHDVALQLDASQARIPPGRVALHVTFVP